MLKQTLSVFLGRPDYIQVFLYTLSSSLGLFATALSIV